MASLGRHKLLLIIVIAVIIAGVAWYGLSGSSAAPASDLTSSATTASGPAGSADQTLVSTLLTLRTVQLDGTIFSDPAFTSLKDFSTQIVPEPVGRSDPFAPLQDNTPPSASSTKSAQIFTPRQ